MKIRWVVISGVSLLISGTMPSCAPHDRAAGEPPLEGVSLTERPGVLLPLELAFTREDGSAAELADYFSDVRPVVLSLAYYDCDMLCPLVLRHAATLALASAGDSLDYRLLSVSIDPRDTPEDAAHRRAELLRGDAGTLDWDFLTSRDSAASVLARSLGFGYRYDPRSGQFAHPAVIFVITPGGRVSRYLYGLGTTNDQFQAALTAAARGEAGSAFERVLLRCFHYMPALRRFAPFLNGSLRIGGAAILLAVMAGLANLVRRAPKQEA